MMPEQIAAARTALSLALPLPMISLIIFTGRADIMGMFVNGKLTRAAALAATAVVLALNVVLIVQTLL